MPHDDGTLTKGEMRDIDQNRRILAERATGDLLNTLVERGVDRLQVEHLRRALAMAYNRGRYDKAN